MKHINDEELIDYLHNAVSVDRDAQIYAHLAQCRGCHSRYEDELAIGDLLRSQAAAQEREFPSLVRAAVWASIRDAEPTPLERFRAAFRPVFAVPVAAAFAMLLYFGVPVVRGERATGSPSVTAAYYFEEHAAQGQQNPLADHNIAPDASLAFGPAAATTSAPLVDAADAATIDDLVASRE